MFFELDNLFSNWYHNLIHVFEFRWDFVKLLYILSSRKYLFLFSSNLNCFAHGIDDIHGMSHKPQMFSVRLTKADDKVKKPISTQG